MDSESCIYIFYTLDDSDQPSVDSIVPLYIGETDKNNRISTHKRKIRDASDDFWIGSATSDWNKYRHLLVAVDELDSPCCIWAKDMAEIEECPYGYRTNQYDLEAKLIGLAIHQDRFRRTLANLEDGVPKKSDMSEINLDQNASGTDREKTQISSRVNLRENNETLKETQLLQELLSGNHGLTHMWSLI